MLNKKFLQTIFGDNWKTSHCTSFTGDPTSIPQSKRGLCWGGGKIGDEILPPGNQYFTISLFSGGRRRKGEFVSTHVIVADDVREKLPLEQVGKLPPPTYRLLTSENSEQWGWVIHPCKDREKVEMLLDGLVRQGLSPSGIDPGMRGVTRYVRLPDGTNSKSNRLINNEPFDCKLLELDETEARIYTVDELALPFDIDLSSSAKPPLSGFQSELTAMVHPILEELTVLSSDGKGTHHVVCPWIDEHSDPKDTSGAAVFILSGGLNAESRMGFKCHHGHCVDRNGGHLVEKIEDTQPDWSARLDVWKVFQSLGVEKPFTDCIAEEKAITDAMHLADMLASLNTPSDADSRGKIEKLLSYSDTANATAKILIDRAIMKHMGWLKRELIQVKDERIKARRIKAEKTKRDNPKGETPTVKIDQKELPDITYLQNGTMKIHSSIRNVGHLFSAINAVPKYSVITKQVEYDFPGLKPGRSDASLKLAEALTIASVNGLPRQDLDLHLIGLAQKNPVNEVLEYLEGLEYRGDGHILRQGACLKVERGTEDVRDMVYRMHMISAVAAADHAMSTPNKEARPTFENILVLVGDQGVNKTSFFKKSFPKDLQRYFKNGAGLDLKNSKKDDIFEVIKFWMVELGEISEILKKVSASDLKRFLSCESDFLRAPYGRVPENYHRTTAFCGSSNHRMCLVDHTGNRRYWPLWVESITDPIDPDAAWAEAYRAYKGGEQWWPTEDQEKAIQRVRESFESPITNEPIEQVLIQLINKGQGPFKADILSLPDIATGLKDAIIFGSRLSVEKVPSNRVLGKVMRRYNLGVSVHSKFSRFWIIRNFSKYEQLSASEIAKIYTDSTAFFK